MRSMAEPSGNALEPIRQGADFSLSRGRQHGNPSPVLAIAASAKRPLPGNVLVNEAANVWLTGFGVASQLPREHQPPLPPGIIAGMLAYVAPEQTGRMNRSIDARSDVYSLGTAGCLIPPGLAVGRGCHNSKLWRGVF
jgi:serine/threonine protein kinase